MQDYFKAKIGKTLEHVFVLPKPYSEKKGTKERYIFGKKFSAEVLDVREGEVWLFVSSVPLMSSGIPVPGVTDTFGDLRVRCEECTGLISVWEKVIEVSDKNFQENFLIKGLIHD